MKLLARLLFISVTTVSVAWSGAAQTDELRQATGLPIQIGQPVIYGRVSIKNVGQGDKKPAIHVSLLDGGSQSGRVQTNDLGYYYFLTIPRGNATLIFEINSTEVGRVVLPLAAGVSRNIRQDFSIDWAEFQRQTANAVISAKDSYVRDSESSKAFENAMRYARENEFVRAVPLLNGIIERDPKDFVAWTELGTLYFKQNSLDNAEACYFKAIELKRDFFVALLNLGKLYVTRKQFDNAVLVLSNAVKSLPESADAHHYLGESYLQLKKGSLAVVELNEALRLSPNDKAEIHLRLATLYDAAGAKDRAAAEYKIFLEKRPNYPDKQKLEAYIKTNPPK